MKCCAAYFILWSNLGLAIGGELYDLLREKGALSERSSRHLFRNLVSALEYCHANLVVHRDLKLENILLDKYNNAKLCDFGLSKQVQPGKVREPFV